MAIAGGHVKARSQSGETQRTRISLPRLMSSGYGTAELGVRVRDVRGVTLCGESPIKTTADRVASGRSNSHADGHKWLYATIRGVRFRSLAAG
jgi:hypothetical protein